MQQPARQGGQEGPLAAKAAAVAAMQQSTKKKGGLDASVASAEDGGATAHLVADANINVSYQRLHQD
jgi:hypothetical protein